MSSLFRRMSKIVVQGKWVLSFRDITQIGLKQRRRLLRRCHLGNRLAEPRPQQPLTYFHACDRYLTRCLLKMIRAHRRDNLSNFYRASEEVSRAQRALLTILWDVLEELQELPTKRRSSVDKSRESSAWNSSTTSASSSSEKSPRMLDGEWIRADRSYQLKFPEAIQEELKTFSEHVLFSATILANGGTIQSREDVAEHLRPLACSLMDSFGQVRHVLRNQCIHDPTSYPDKLRETMMEFDEIWGDFEQAYVTIMLDVSATNKIRMHEEAKFHTTLLFLESMSIALDRHLIRQEDIDSCEPSVMMSLPRLALLYGLTKHAESNDPSDKMTYLKNGSLRMFVDKHEITDDTYTTASSLVKLQERLANLTAKELAWLEQGLLDTISPCDSSSYEQHDASSEENLHELFKTMASIADPIQSGEFTKEVRDVMKVAFDMYKQLDEVEPLQDMAPQMVPNNVISHRNKIHYYQILNRGQFFIKYGRCGKPAQRFIWLTDNLKEIMWKTTLSDNRSTYESDHIFINQILEIRRGCRTNVFHYHNGSALVTEDKHLRCFSIIFKDRTLDLEAESSEVCDVWCEAISQITACPIVKGSIVTS